MLTFNGLIIPFGHNNNKQRNNTNTYINTYIYGHRMQPCAINQQAFSGIPSLANKWIRQMEEKENKTEPTTEVTIQWKLSTKVGANCVLLCAFNGPG